MCWRAVVLRAPEVGARLLPRLSWREDLERDSISSTVPARWDPLCYTSPRAERVNLHRRARNALCATSHYAQDTADRRDPDSTRACHCTTLASGFGHGRLNRCLTAPEYRWRGRSYGCDGEYIAVTCRISPPRSRVWRQSREPKGHRS